MVRPEMHAFRTTSNSDNDFSYSPETGRCQTLAGEINRKPETSSSQGQRFSTTITYKQMNSTSPLEGSIPSALTKFSHSYILTGPDIQFHA
jgi:hypothetical protein